MLQIEHHAVISPLLTVEECGDHCVVLESEELFFVCVIDVLGHGYEAHLLAKKIEDFISENYNDDIILLIKDLHMVTKSERGAALTMLLIDKKTGKGKYCAIGNVSTIMIDSVQRYRFVNKEGIVGQVLPNVQLNEFDFLAGQMVVIYSDGVKHRFDYTYSDCEPKKIAKDIMTRYGKKNDDSICMVLQLR